MNISTALGSMLALWLIGLAGFVEGTTTGSAAEIQPRSAVLAIAVGYAGLPALFKLPAWWLMRGYDVTRERMEYLRTAGCAVA